MPVTRLWSVVLVAVLAVLPTLPPEHVHEETDGQGHQVLVAHRHVQLHTTVARHTGRADTVDHADPVSAIPDGIYTVSTRFVHRVPLARAAVLPPAPVARRAVVARRFSDRLIHGPPRAPSSLRAPPTLRLL